MDLAQRALAAFGQGGLTMKALSRALSMTQPWAQLVVEGHKRFETRSWYTGYRGPIAIHASKSFPRACQRLLYDDGDLIADRLNRPPEELQRGAIIGVVTIRDCLSVSNLRSEISEAERAFGDFSEGRYAWQLDDSIWVRPIPVRGMLGLWTIPEDIRAQLIQQL